MEDKGSKSGNTEEISDCNVSQLWPEERNRQEQDLPGRVQCCQRYPVPYRVRLARVPLVGAMREKHSLWH